MARKRNYRRANRKRRAYKRRVYNKKTATLGLGFPKKVKIVHKYCETITLSPSTGTMSVYNFSANGMYDPNITGTGHQPLYFDQMTPIYDHYTVIGSKIKVTFSEIDAPSFPIQCGIFLNDNTTLIPTLASDVAEQSLGRIKLLSSDHPWCVQSKKFSLKKIYGKVNVSQDGYRGDASSNPTEQSYYSLFAQCYPDQSATVQCLVELEYIAIWSELKDIASS